MGYGDGSLWQNDNGTWTAKATIAGKRYRRNGRTKTEARARIAELRRQIETGTHEPRKATAERRRRERATIGAVLDQFLDLDLASRDRAPSTVERHRWAAEHVRSRIGDHEARSLKVTDVEAMLRASSEAGLSRSSVDKLRNTLSQALRAGVRREIVDRDVARDAVLPASARRPEERSALDPDDARRLLAELRGRWNGLAFALSLRLGLRPGEAWALHWTDIGDNYVNVVRGLRRHRGQVEIVDDLKTAGSARTIALPDDLRPWIEEHRRSQVQERLASETWTDDRLVFATEAGAPMQPDRSRALLADACDVADVPRTRPNELRHSCASLLSDEGVPNELIADLLGHTTTRMVDQTYRHRLRPVVDVAATATWAAADENSGA